jgi:glycosyltransferase 2 family protein
LKRQLSIVACSTNVNKARPLTDHPMHQEDDNEKRLPITTASGEEMRPEQADKYARGLGDLVKYSLILIIMIGAGYFLFQKLQSSGVTYEKVKNAFLSIPPLNIAAAIALTIANFFLLTGYDWVAVRYLKKEMPIHRIMIGAFVGYAISNVLGWLLGGTAARYRLYRRWGFTPVEIIAFVSILSITFWLGMFLLAGIAFALLPIDLPEEFKGKLFFDHHVLGWIFLAVVAIYLIASAFIRKPIRWKSYRYALPPLKLSIMQLIVSSFDFLITSLVLYCVIPTSLTGPDATNFSTVLISYLTGMILVVLTHAPGGTAVLDGTIISVFPDEAMADIVAAIIMFRIIYYIIPGIFAAIVWGSLEASWRKQRRQNAAINSAAL